MPRRNDIQKILVIGSGPIVIGQSAEFDYSGTQACKALKQEGYEVVLVNSNPATIMTDPDLADRTYIEPLTREYVEEIIRLEAAMLAADPKSGKFALLPTVGGQTALNLAVDLADAGILDKYNVELIGAKLEAIKKAEDRLLFKDAMLRIGLDVSKSALVNNLRDGLDFAAKLGFPVLIRPSFTLGGTGGGIAYNREELLEILARGLDLSPVHECLIEESVLGWKEYELEVMRDLAEGCGDAHHLACGLHLRAEHCIDAAELGPGEDGRFDVVVGSGWQIVAGGELLGKQFAELAAGHEAGGHLGEGNAGCLGDVRHGARGAGVYFDDVDMVVAVSVALDGELQIDQADDFEGEGQLARVGAQDIERLFADAD